MGTPGFQSVGQFVVLSVRLSGREPLGSGSLAEGARMREAGPGCDPVDPFFRKSKHEQMELAGSGGGLGSRGPSGGPEAAGRHFSSSPLSFWGGLFHRCVLLQVLFR